MPELNVFGCPASHAPVLHLRFSRLDGMAATYAESFERVWAGARDAWPEAGQASRRAS